MTPMRLDSSVRLEALELESHRSHLEVEYVVAIH